MKRHLFSDPIYGLIEIQPGIILQLVEHRYFQRLLRISQLGFTQYVFPSATHTRFSHALGALHLTQQAVQNLRKQGISISEAEEQAVCIAILLHDIGHAPFSHSLEFALVQVHHEAFSLALMEELNEEFGGQLSLAIQIFKDEYPQKKFLHQLVSSQLDMDRLDYLTRDSFFTGVHEGIVGYDRILKMLTVTEQGELIVDGKGIYSVEKFLIARRLMYWQVYLHKTVAGASELLLKVLQRARKLLAEGAELPISPALRYFLSQNLNEQDFLHHKKDLLTNYIRLDDMDIWMALKQFALSPDKILQFLSESLLHRRLFKIRLSEQPISQTEINNVKAATARHFGISESDSEYLVLVGSEANRAYQLGEKEIQILLKNGQLRPISKWQEYHIPDAEVVKYFIGYPKQVDG